MVVTSVAAAAVAFLVACGAIRHPKLAFWRRWDPAAVRMRVIPMFAIGPATGALVAVILGPFAEQALPEADFWDLVTGVACGALTVLVLRPEIPSRDRSPVTPARTLFTALLKLADGGLDRAARKAIRRKLGVLDTPTLCRVSGEVFRDYFAPRLGPVEAEGTKAFLAHQQERALGATGRPDENGIDQVTHIDARARLKHHTLTVIVATQAVNVDLHPEPSLES